MAFEVPVQDKGSLTDRVKKALPKNRNVMQKVKQRLGPGSNQERFKQIAARRLAKGKTVPRGIAKKLPGGTQQTGKPFPKNVKYSIPENKEFYKNNPSIPKPSPFGAGAAKEPREKQPEASPEAKKAAHLAAFKEKMSKAPRRRS